LISMGVWCDSVRNQLRENECDCALADSMASKGKNFAGLQWRWINLYLDSGRLMGVAVSRSAMVVGPETNEVTNDQDPERRCEQGAQTAALPAGRDVDMRTLVRRLPIEPASS